VQAGEEGNVCKKEAKTEPAEVCPRCGKPMEPVCFSNDATGLLVYHGEPPPRLLGQLAQVFTGSLVRTESGEPVLFGFERDRKARRD
jgi:hypothetical protein